MSNKVTILRGCPGSGKSCYARTLTDAIIVSPDNFRIKRGVYTYVHLDHTPFKKTLSALNMHCKNGAAHIVVDSTNILPKYFDPYIKVAKAHKYAVEIITIVPETAHTAWKRNLHQVPFPTIFKMYTESMLTVPSGVDHRFLCWPDF